jgi:hypothetical protein
MTAWVLVATCTVEFGLRIRSCLSLTLERALRHEEIMLNKRARKELVSRKLGNYLPRDEGVWDAGDKTRNNRTNCKSGESSWSNN